MVQIINIYFLGKKMSKLLLTLIASVFALNIASAATEEHKDDAAKAVEQQEEKKEEEKKAE